MAAATESINSAPALTPYVPRLVLDWWDTTPQDRSRRVEGTMVYVDLAGFTRMSERLGRKGKVGAEEVTDVVNTTFSSLLSVAYEADGSLLKFGGDALLLFFTGDAHPERGCFAAWGMRAALRHQHTVTTAGQVQLRMTTGVHSGAFDFFLVGESHRELIITGPSATDVVDVEHSARAGDIVVSGDTARVLPANVLGATRRDGRLLRRMPQPTFDRSEPALPQAQTDPSGLISSAVRDHVRGGTIDAEHRHACIGFIRFRGVDRPLAVEGPGRVAVALDELLRSVQAAADDHDVSFIGSDIASDGGKLILCAGAPQSHGNDEERMLLALSRVRRQGCSIEWSGGVHAGHAFIGDIGPFYRRTYTAMGDVVNTAARIGERAAPNETYATGEVLDRSATRFELTPVLPFTAKGKSRPIPAWRVGDAIGAYVDVDRSLPFAGREAELAELVELARSLEKGSGGLAVIVGEPGIGKSRLIDELRTRMSQLQWASTACEQYRSSTAFFPFRRLLFGAVGLPVEAGAEEFTETVSGILPDLSESIPLLSSALDVRGSASADPGRLDDASRQARLRHMATQLCDRLLSGPAVLVFDDAHWMDGASRDLVDHLAIEALRRPWLLLVAGQEAGAVAPLAAHGRTIRLGPLPEPDCVSLARSSAPDGLLPAQASQLARRSGGNPLFLKELVGFAGAPDDVDALPLAVEALVAARIDRLAPADRMALRRIAVLGNPFDPRLMRTLGMGDVRWRRLDEFIERDGDRIRFRYALIQQVAYAGLSYRTRRSLHERVGTYIESGATDPDEEAVMLSLHFHAAQRFDKSWRYSRKAAAKAQERFAYSEAASLFRRALAASRHVAGLSRDEIASSWVALGWSLKAAGRFQEATVAYGSARTLVRESPVDWARICCLEGWVRDDFGRYAEALRWYGRGLRALEEEKNEEAFAMRATLRLAAAGARYFQGRLDECIKLSLQVAEEAEATRERVLQANAYQRLHLSYTALRDPRRRKYGELALLAWSELGLLSEQGEVLNNLGMDAYFDGDWEEALRLYERSRDALGSAGREVQSAIAASNIGEILVDQGILDTARTILSEAVVTFRAARSQFLVAALGHLARTAAREGAFDESRELLEEAGRVSSTTGSATLTAETDARRAEALLLEGRAGEAADLSGRTLASAPETLKPLLLRTRGLALVSLGRAADGREDLDDSLRTARACGLDYEAASTMEAIARFARLSRQDHEPFESDAIRILERLGVQSRPLVPLGEQVSS